MATSAKPSVIEMGSSARRLPTPDTCDGLSLDMDPEMRKLVINNETLLTRVLWVKIVGYMFHLIVLGGITTVSLVCIATGMTSQIWPMLLTYILGTLTTKEKAGRFVKGVISERMKNGVRVPKATVGPYMAGNNSP